MLMESGMIWALFGVTWAFGWVIVGLVASHMKSKRRNERLRMVHEERMKAMEKEIPLPEFPELEEENGNDRWGGPAKPSNPRSVLGAAALIASAGIGVSVMFSLWGSVTKDSDLYGLWPIGLLGVFVGLGLVFYYYLTRPQES